MSLGFDYSPQAMAADIDPTKQWGAADLAHRLGNIPLTRVRLVPAPGTATEEDLIIANERKQGICELIDGALVEKPMGHYESYLTVILIGYLLDYLKVNPIGYVIGESGSTRFSSDQIRIPDISLFLWKNHIIKQVSKEKIGSQIPDLVVEVLSRGNSNEEMSSKLTEYLVAGVPLVWYIDPRVKQVKVFTSSTEPRVLTERNTLDGGSVLPGLAIDLAAFFAAGEGPPEAKSEM